jgi:hypothetical protein
MQIDGHEPQNWIFEREWTAGSTSRSIHSFGLSANLQTTHLSFYLSVAQIPAFLLTLLAYAFWISFYRIGSHVIDPTTWPLIWLGFAAFFMINPLPIWRKSSRWWFLKSVGRLLLPGMTRVEVCVILR